MHVSNDSNMNHYNEKLVKQGAAQILEGMGIVWGDDDNFKETPDRVARSFYEFCHGSYEDFDTIKTFPSTYNGIVMIKSIQAIGLCPHHLLPIEYTISFGYIPKGKVIGLSKIPRIIKHLCARPVLQEDLTKDLVKFFKQKLNPAGIAIVIRGIHGCMKFRGVGEANEVQTAELDGYFLTSQASRAEFYSMVSD